MPYEEVACLYENQTEFNYLPAALLDEAKVQGGRVLVGDYAYRGVVNVLGEAYEERFGDKLGHLLWNVPVKSTDSVMEAVAERYGRAGEAGADENGSGEAECGAETDKQPRETAAAYVVRMSQPCRTLRKVLLRKCGVDMLLFGNEGNEEIRADITVSGLKEPLFLDLWKGKTVFLFL